MGARRVNDVTTCQHVWLTFPWYKMCVYCDATDDPRGANIRYIEQDEPDHVALDARPWYHLETNDPDFMHMVRTQRCVRCSGSVSEEAVTRRDGSRHTVILCMNAECLARWDVPED